MAGDRDGFIRHLPAEGAAEPTPAILLAALNCVPAHPFNPAAPAITACDQPDEQGRPYLLHTQLIQELHRLGEAAAAEDGLAEKLAREYPWWRV